VIETEGIFSKILAFDWLSVRARHLHFVSVLKRKADFELFNTRISFQSLNLTKLVARREIPEGEPNCFTGNSKWLSLFVLKCQTHPLSGKSSFIPECDQRAISRRNLSGTTLDLPECVSLALGDTEVTRVVPRWSEIWRLVPGLTISFDPLFLTSL